LLVAGTRYFTGVELSAERISGDGVRV
jgi:hypothetical protein